MLQHPLVAKTLVNFLFTATAGGGEWSGWTSWSECKGSYGEEVTINRTRSCINQSSTNGTCPGDATESKKCKPVTCQGGNKYSSYAKIIIINIII